MLAILTAILNGEIRFDDSLNGSLASPAYESVVSSAPLPMSPAGGAVDMAMGGGPKSAPRAVLLAWMVLFGLLIVTHVLTISVQR